MELRGAGKSYREIAEILSVSRSSCSRWLKDMPLTTDQQKALQERTAPVYLRRAATLRRRTDHRVAAIIRDAAAEVGTLSVRDLFVVGVVAYWAEGTKSKPWSRKSRVNSSTPIQR